MDEKISKLFLPLLDKLYHTEPAGEPFRKPVDVVKYGCFDYYYYVKHPIDLSTIRERLTSHQYQDAWRFVADIQLMFANAYLFNKKGTPVYEFTNKLSKIWNSELTPIMQRLNYCCGTLHKFGPQLLFCYGTTSDRYCQIPIGAKYKCYQDQYSFCMPCFNKIDSDYVNIQGLSCETVRMKLPTQPVKKSEFNDCANDSWQYESFVQCTQCSRRVHQICDLYPGDEDQIEACLQHAELEHQQKMLCQVPEEYRVAEEAVEQSNDGEPDTRVCGTDAEVKVESDVQAGETANKTDPSDTGENMEHLVSNHQTSLDDELMQFARDVDDFANSTPSSPSNLEAIRVKLDNARGDSCEKASNHGNSSNDNIKVTKSRGFTNNTTTTSNSKNIDNIAARLSINKKSAECQPSDGLRKQVVTKSLNRDKFVCNHCYRRKRVGFNLRHRKYSARRLPHTRMSRYIETKVNEHIRENSPSAGEVTIRVLTAYRDIIEVKQEMRDYIRRTKSNDLRHHPFLQDYPDQFGYTNRAIFAWQEIDGVDVCVFGMHVQEYGDDCPEPNRQVIYLSYIDSVHFFRPKQVRTAVYHEILLSYFKYVKKLGFRRVFIWVCPSRKGDDYIFYRHPAEQKMPTLKRLSDWYVNLLDKCIMAGVVERHQNIYQFAGSQNWSPLLSLPYLSGDYWPGEFERLLKIMIESQKELESKLQSRKELGLEPIHVDISDLTQLGEGQINSLTYSEVDHNQERHNILSLSTLYQKAPPTPVNGKVRSATSNSAGARFLDLDNSNLGDESKLFDQFTPDSSRSDDQPLDLSKSSSNTSPESYYDDDQMSELSFASPSNKKKRRKPSSTMCYTKKRSRNNSSIPVSQNIRGTRNSQAAESMSRFLSQGSKPSRLRSSTQAHKDPHTSELLIDPESELVKNLERSLKRQKDGFIVARLNDCDCPPHFETQRRKEEATFTCELMKGREPFLQLARLKNYEFSTLRRAKFSSLAMVKHLSQSLKLDPICNECFSFDSSKRHYACPMCEDYYLCTSCHENTHHDHIMSLMAPSTLPDIDEFMQQCSLTSTTNSISSASSTISNKSFNDSNIELLTQSIMQSTKRNLSTTAYTPLNRHLSNTLTSPTMPLGSIRLKNRELTSTNPHTEDVENAFGGDTKLQGQPSPPPSHSANNVSYLPIELNQVLFENFVRQTQLSYDVDLDQMMGQSHKLLSHYFSCPARETCFNCKFVVMSCSFMSILMRSSRMQMMFDFNPSETLTNPTGNSSHQSGMNLTTTPRYSYQPKDK